MCMCTGMFLLKTAYGYGKRMFMRRFGDCVVYTYQFHVPCGSCRRAVFLISTFAGSMRGRSKVEPGCCKLSCTLSPHDVKNISTVIEQSQS